MKIVKKTYEGKLEFEAGQAAGGKLNLMTFFSSKQVCTLCRSSLQRLASVEEKQAGKVGQHCNKVNWLWQQKALSLAYQAQGKEGAGEDGEVVQGMTAVMCPSAS